MICQKCSNEVKDGSRFCPYCGSEIINTDNNLSNNNMSNNINGAYNGDKKVNIWLAVLSWFILIAGLIVFLVKKDDEPKTAKVSGICALISFVLSIIVVFFVFKFVFSFMDEFFDSSFEMIENIEDTVNDNVDNNGGVNGSTSNNNSLSWNKYEVLINDEVVVLPTTYDILSKLTGFSYKSSDLKSYLEGSHYTYLNMYKNDNLALYVDVLNDSNEDLLYTDCKITRITQSKYQVLKGADVVIFPGGLKAGEVITEEKIIDIFGTPDDIDGYSNDGYVSNTYLFLEDSSSVTVNNFKITVVNGVIDELQLDHRY